MAGQASRISSWPLYRSLASIRLTRTSRLQGWAASTLEAGASTPKCTTCTGGNHGLCRRVSSTVVWENASKQSAPSKMRRCDGGRGDQTSQPQSRMP